ncbi:hypothetical protein M3Y98_00635600 [Aphelenchoides besseyi]|nr:hypothetical protein M3Y98_00635600 [Aphelenchoides besseyi]KAI6208518.1 hypothetical protein M3Y96_00123800 [Aphelenchoides besseyi]
MAAGFRNSQLEWPCGPTFKFQQPAFYAQVSRIIDSENLIHSCWSTIDSRIFYLYTSKGLYAIDTFCDSLICIPYHRKRIFISEFFQITTNIFILRVHDRLLKIRMNFEERKMETIEERSFGYPFRTSERLSGDRFLIYHWNADRNEVHFDLYHIDDSTPHRTFTVNSPITPIPDRQGAAYWFQCFNIIDEKLYYFTQFTATENHRDLYRLDLSTLHVLDMTTGNVSSIGTSKLPFFHYALPSNIANNHPLFIKSSFWVDHRLFIRLREMEGVIPFYHLIFLDITTMQWRLVAKWDIESKSTIVVSEATGILTLIKSKGPKQQSFHRIFLRRPDSLFNLAHFALKKFYPHILKMTATERLARRLPSNLSYSPFFWNQQTAEDEALRGCEKQVLGLGTRILRPLLNVLRRISS